MFFWEEGNAMCCLRWGKRVLIAVLVAMPVFASAAPAAWYKWQSRATGQFICTQTWPGEGWLKIAGPYGNGGCRS